ncbi:MAG: type IV toxin-antitoxin system AbiEi family antitoxin domain-containing protein [Candidatus Ratteibacteria bacterium]
MQNRREKLVDFFKSKSGIVRFSDILKAGFHTDSISALVKEGKVEKIAHGIYKLTGRNYTFERYPDFVTTSIQAPRGVICLISALSFYEITTEIPRYVNIAIPQGTHAYRIKYPPVRLYRFDFKSWKSGIEKHEIGGYEIKIYSLAKTIADCFKFRNKIGVNIAREALKSAVKEKGVKPTEIMHYAKICRVDKIIKPILVILL